jgi:hypothetical protein
MVTMEPANGLETLETSELRTVSGGGGFTFGINMAIGSVNSGNQLALEFSDSDGVPASRGGSGTEGVLQARLTSASSCSGLNICGLKISDNGGSNPALIGVNFDSGEGMVIDVIEGQIDTTFTSFFLGSAPSLSAANPESNPNSFGALQLDDINLDGSFIKMKIQ